MAVTGHGRRIAELERRIAELSEEIQECRATNLRVAELTDVVLSLVAPLAEGDVAGAREVVARYRAGL